VQKIVFKAEKVNGLKCKLALSRIEMLTGTVKAYGLKELYLKLTIMDKNELVVPDGLNQLM
jgi:hypothetical protein